jgi:hypothetical protein
MSSVLLDAGGSDTFTLTGAIVYGTDFKYTRNNQFEQEAADGVLSVSDGGPTVVHGVLMMKNISYTDGVLFRAFLESKLIFAKTSFSMTPPATLDFGKGTGTTLTSVNYDGGNTDKGVLELMAPGVWKLEFPYRFVKAQESQEM